MYAIHPGFIISKNDGERHYISALELINLYKLKLGEYIIWDDNLPQTYLGKNLDDYFHLYPRFDGNYNETYRKNKGG